ncbi:MAG: ParB/RepB/Spo0J family partition protein [Chloroflexota bacterium]|nr:ParB/RepB/Spo0J family partition protein [Chloroflexota bacterium]
MAERAAFKQNIQRLFNEASSTELSPGIVSLLESRDTKATVREVPVDRVLPNPAQPRLSYVEDQLSDLADSIREHGVLQPILVRAVGAEFELVAGERRWRAARVAGLKTIPAIVTELDDRGALEVSIIENLQREDLSPLDEAAMYRRMTVDLGYSVRALAQRIGKDKGYVENRLRLADAPPEVRELVSQRRDTLSHAYELMKIHDERVRRRLAAKVAAGELTLAKLRQRTASDDDPDGDASGGRRGKTLAGEVHGPEDDSLLGAKGKLAEAVEELTNLLRDRQVLDEIPEVNRDNLARYLTVTKVKIENAIAIIRSGNGGQAV